MNFTKKKDNHWPSSTAAAAAGTMPSTSKSPISSAASSAELDLPHSIPSSFNRPTLLPSSLIWSILVPFGNFPILPVLFLLLIFAVFSSPNLVASALFADFATVPKGTNPTLYDAEDFVVQLDELTFNDTVFCGKSTTVLNGSGNGNSGDGGLLALTAAADAITAAAGGDQKCTSLVVEFYSDWCGHCRAYARVYKALAKDLLGWSEILKLAAINCADPINLMTCRASGITHYPFIKYFPRNSSAEGLLQSDGAAEGGANANSNGANVGQLLHSYQSLAAMRDQFTRAILAEYEENRYEDWPNFDWLGIVETYGQLWEGISDKIQTMIIIFEASQESLIGAQLLLDLSKFGDKISARRCANNALANALQIHDFPTFAIFRRGQRSPVHISELRRLMFTEIEQFMRNESSVLASSSAPSRLLTFARRRSATGNQEHFCNAHPQICRRAYFLSELDMLKSVRIALFNDIHLGGPQIGSHNLTALFNFVDLLANNFPYSSQRMGVEDVDQKMQFLNASSRARVVFSHLRDFIESRASANGAITVDQWRAEFLRAELDQQNPFPIAQSWEHCKGSSPVLRGFTCGLWMVFHSLTVNSFKIGAQKGVDEFHPIAVLRTFRDWVGAFFACEHCRHHFLKMTTKVARIENLVRRKEDVFLYLWRAHNMVNARLKGRETEDPQFPKFQFPSRFLCPECRKNGNGTEEFDEAKVKEFLLAFYSDVRPIDGGTEDGDKVGGMGEEAQQRDEAVTADNGKKMEEKRD